MRYSLARLDLTLLALLGLTLATMAVAGATRAPVLVDGIVLAIAAIKGRRILLDYLDLRSAPALWRGLATAWLMLIVGFAWAASAVSVLLPPP
jgi:cytochrome c oxidase subunit IV